MKPLFPAGRPAMRPLSIVALVGVLVGVGGLRAEQPRGEPVATIDELHQLLAAKKYQPLLQKIARITSAKPDAPGVKGYDRFDLYMTKAEAMLQQRQISLAVDAYRAAAKEAKEPTDAAKAEAMALLAGKSPQQKYLPKPGGKFPHDSIDILDPARRPDALAALFADEMAAAEPKIHDAADASSLLPLMNVLEAVRKLRVIEVASTGKDEQTAAAAKSLDAHVAELMTNAISSMRDNMGRIERAANTINLITDENGNTYKQRRGLDTYMYNALKDVRDTCTKINEVASHYGQANHDEKLSAIGGDAAGLAGHATLLINTDWSKESGNAPNPTPRRR